MEKRTRKSDDVESASFLLACLKRNNQYKDFFEKNRGRVLSAYREWRSAVLEDRAPKIPSVNRLGEEIPLANMFKGFFEPVDYTHVWFHKCLEADFGIVTPPFDISMLGTDGHREVLTADESFDFLDPMKDIEFAQKERREAALRCMFSACGIRHVVHNDKDREGSTEQASISVFDLEQREKQQRRYEVITSGGTSPWFKDKLVPFPLSGLLPHERLLVVDLRKKKTELRKEFDAFFDRMKYHRENTKDSEWGKNYSRWKLDTKRDREQKKRHLDVWNMVTRRGMKFNEIAKELKNIAVSDVEYSFRQAHVLTQGFPCPPWELLTLRKFEKSALANICKKCDKHSDRGSDGWRDCKFAENCEEFKRYVNQGSIPEIRGIRNAPLVPFLADDQVLGNVVLEGKAPLRERGSKPDRKKKGVVLRKAVKK